jgi:hypothetical protein
LKNLEDKKNEDFEASKEKASQVYNNWPSLFLKELMFNQSFL